MRAAVFTIPSRGHRIKPTHMIGGYAQLSYGFNYYGTVGSNRDEFVIVRKMDKVDWMDEPAQVEAAE
jgi:nitrate reductase alpha subunit